MEPRREAHDNIKYLTERVKGRIEVLGYARTSEQIRVLTSAHLIDFGDIIREIECMYKEEKAFLEKAQNQTDNSIGDQEELVRLLGAVVEEGKKIYSSGLQQYLLRQTLSKGVSDILALTN